MRAMYGILLAACLAALSSVQTASAVSFYDQEESAESAEPVAAEPEAGDDSTTLASAGAFLAESAAVAQDSCACPSCDSFCCEADCCDVESSWYTRAEYFHWNERVAGADYVNEYGVMPTIGYFRRVDNRRLRLEFFGSQVAYLGQDMNTGDPIRSHTNYIGGRAEYDFFFLPGTFRYFEFVGGLGLRIWDRDLVTQGSSQGYHELFVTVYPYIGIETMKNPNRRIEPFARARLGVTAFNYEYVSTGQNLYPVANITGLFEAGLRTERMFVSGYLESFAWKESPQVAGGFSQPDSTWFTTGVQFGVYR